MLQVGPENPPVFVSVGIEGSLRGLLPAFGNCSSGGSLSNRLITTHVFTCSSYTSSRFCCLLYFEGEAMCQLQSPDDSLSPVTGPVPSTVLSVRHQIIINSLLRTRAEPSRQHYNKLSHCQYFDESVTQTI